MMAELGVIMLMLLAGLELNLEDLLQSGRVSALAGTLGVLIPLGLGYGVSILFGLEGVAALFAHARLAPAAQLGGHLEGQLLDHHRLERVAGHVDPGESVTRAALREIGEEVGLGLAPERLRVVGVMHRKSDDERVDFFLACELDGEEAPRNREPGKCSELVWACLVDLPADTIPYVRAALVSYRRGVWFEEFGWETAARSPAP